jgi:hypothetical protein
MKSRLSIEHDLPLELVGHCLGLAKSSESTADECGNLIDLVILRINTTNIRLGAF